MDKMGAPVAQEDSGEGGAPGIGAAADLPSGRNLPIPFSVNHL
jgi:hypothetical protein